MRKRISKLQLIILAVAVLLSLCAISAGIVFAKYKNEKTSQGLVGAKNFYFSSNLLDGREHTLGQGRTSITFTLGNHEDELRFSDVDVNYTVTVNNGATVTDEDGNGTGTIPAGAPRDVSVTIENMQAGKTYTVTAKGENGYSKTISATLVIPAAEARLFYHTDSSAGDYILLTVWNEGDAAGNVTIAYTGIPDNTNPNMGDWTANATREDALGARESKTYRFFGGTVTVTGAEPKNPN